MGSHDAVRELLVAYADGQLPSGQVAAVERHLPACVECAAELSELRQLNLALANFPPAPPVPFHPFWAKLQAALPAPPAERRSLFAPGRRMALAVVLAALLALTVGVTAFASESALPDNPLYSVKRLREQVQLTLTMDQQARLQLEIQLAVERLREARVMAGNGRPELAVASLRDFDALMTAAGAALQRAATDADRGGVESIIQSLRLQLTGVDEVNETRGGDDREVKASVEKARQALAADEPKDGKKVKKIFEKKGDDPRPQVSTSAPAAQQSETPDPKESEKPESESSSGR